MTAQTDPAERPTAREIFERMRDAATPIGGWRPSVDYITAAAASAAAMSDAAESSNHDSSSLSPVHEVRRRPASTSRCPFGHHQAYFHWCRPS